MLCPAMAASFSLDSLNAAQRDAVLAVDGPVLILAGAGTGKTRVITHRIAHLLQRGVVPEAICAVTFTNKAAGEMRERAARLAPKDAIKAVTISTFHSLCVRILRGGIEKLGYKSNFTIYDESDQLGLIKKIITRSAARGEKLDPGLAKAMIGKAKNLLWTPAESEESLLRTVYERYIHELKLLNAVDFDDLLLLAVRLLHHHEDVRERWRQRYTHFMVDEFQDTNRLQLDLLQLLAGDPPNVCVVGDDDQSIYGWRGAETSNILEFESHFPNPRIVKLEENYRSTRIILDAANSVIRNNPRRRPKTLRTARGDGARVRLIAAPDEREEARFVVEEIHRRHIEEKLPLEEFAILFRINMQARPFEEQLRQLQIPYKLVGARSFFDRREVKDLLAWLNVCLQPGDDISLLRIVNSPPRGIGETTVARALDRSAQDETSVYATLSNPGFKSFLASKTAAAILDFTVFLDGFAARFLQPLADYSALAGELLEESGYRAWLKRTCQTPEEAASREESLNLVLSWMADHRAMREGGLRGFLDDVTLDRDRDKEDKNEKRGVTLITMHAAKGLEFAQVYIAGAEEGLLPHSRSREENRLDEERRLLYVAITRAMQTLCITWCNSRTRHGQPMPGHRSTFLGELDPATVDEQDFHELQTRPASEESAQFHFSRMRALLNAGRPATS